MVKSIKKRNSLIELYRFIFALNVVKNHGYFPYQGSYFSPGAYSVEFFFVLTGFFLIKSLDNCKCNGMLKGVFCVIWRKIRAIVVPLIIGIVFNIIYKISIGDFSSGIWMYLWYVHDMLAVITIYYILRKLIKSEKSFFVIVLIIAFTFNTLHFIEVFYSWGWFRALGSISVGMLISYIPPIPDKYKKYVWIALIPTMVSVLCMLLFKCSMFMEIILNMLLYPALIYLTLQINVSCKLFNYLGSLSFGLYAFQSIARCAKQWGVNNLWLLFIIILVPTLIENLLKKFINNCRKITNL